MGWRQETPSWTDYRVRIQEGQHRRKGQEVDSPSERSLMVVGAGWGDGKLTT